MKEKQKNIVKSNWLRNKRKKRFFSVNELEIHKIKTNTIKASEIENNKKWLDLCTYDTGTEESKARKMWRKVCNKKK